MLKPSKKDIAEPKEELLYFSSTESIHFRCGKCVNPKDIRGRHAKSKRRAKVGQQVAGAGIGVAQKYVADASVAAAVIGGATLSATGVGLAVGGVVLTAAGSYEAHRSMKKTATHVRNLRKILNNRLEFSCDARGTPEHSYISGKILPYIIQQKLTKRARKSHQIFPIVGAGYEAGKSFKHMVRKRWKGTKGKQRGFAAQSLAVHMLTHHCGLTEAIVAELYSDGEMEAMKFYHSDYVASMIQDKIKTI